MQINGHTLFDMQNPRCYYFIAAFTNVNDSKATYTFRGEMSMYQGKNGTALQSQQWLGESLVRLMDRAPYNAITIGAICKEADLSRQTFYNVFESKEEVLRFCLRQQYEKQFQRFAAQDVITVGEIVEAFAVVVAENQDILRVMIENQLDSILADEITRCVALFAGKFVRKEQKREQLPYSEALLSGALGHLLVYWFRQERPISMEQLTQLITEFLEGQLFEMA